MDNVSIAYDYKSLFEKALELAAKPDQNPASQHFQRTHLVTENKQESKTRNVTPGNQYHRYYSTSSSGSDSTNIERPWTAPNTTTDASHQQARSPVRHRRHSAKPSRKISTVSSRNEQRPRTPEKQCQRSINNWIAFNENIYMRSISADRSKLSQKYKNAVNRSPSPNRAKSSKQGRSRQRKKGYVVLKEGEAFSPILWRKFHIEDHLFDTTHDDRLTEDEIKENINQMKIKYPHLTKYYDPNENYIHNTLEDKRQRIFNKPTDNQTDDDKHARQNYLWKRHVDMMKVSKSTSYYNFLSNFDRQSCRACSHSKACTSKHCGSCECGTECEKHSINVDFLKYRPYSSVDMDKKEHKTHNNKKQQHLVKQQEHLKPDSKAVERGQGLTMHGFTIVRKTPDMGRITLLSTHIDGEHCTSKSGHKKCLVCAMAKENVLLQSRKKPLFQTKSAPAKLRRFNIVRSNSVPSVI